MAKMERPCPPMVMLAFPLLAILTLRGLMRLRPQQMPPVRAVLPAVRGRAFDPPAALGRAGRAGRCAAALRRDFARSPFRGPALQGGARPFAQSAAALPDAAARRSGGLAARDGAGPARLHGRGADRIHRAVTLYARQRTDKKSAEARGPRGFFVSILSDAQQLRDAQHDVQLAGVLRNRRPERPRFGVFRLLRRGHRLADAAEHRVAVHTVPVGNTPDESVIFCMFHRMTILSRRAPLRAVSARSSRDLISCSCRQRSAACPLSLHRKTEFSVRILRFAVKSATTLSDFASSL